MKDAIFEFVMALALLILTAIVCVRFFFDGVQPENFQIFSLVAGFGGLIMVKLNQISKQNDKEKSK